MPLFLERGEAPKTRYDAILAQAADRNSREATVTGGRREGYLITPGLPEGPLHRTREKLAYAYESALNKARELGCVSIATQLLSGGGRLSPARQVKLAEETIRQFLEETDDAMTVRLFLPEGASLFPATEATKALARLLADAPPDRKPGRKLLAPRKKTDKSVKKASRRILEDVLEEDEVIVARNVSCDMLSISQDFGSAAAMPQSLEARLGKLDLSFSEKLLHLIDRSGMKDSEVYKKANIDRKLFSKIRCRPDYHPNKETVVAFAVALKLPPDETDDLLRSAGFALSGSSPFDVIVRFYIERGDYDVDEINNTLYTYDQKLLGNILV